MYRTYCGEDYMEWISGSPAIQFPDKATFDTYDKTDLRAIVESCTHVKCPDYNIGVDGACVANLINYSDNKIDCIRLECGVLKYIGPAVRHIECVSIPNISVLYNRNIHYLRVAIKPFNLAGMERFLSTTTIFRSNMDWPNVHLVEPASGVIYSSQFDQLGGFEQANSDIFDDLCIEVLERRVFYLSEPVSDKHIHVMRYLLTNKQISTRDGMYDNPGFEFICRYPNKLT